MTQWAALGLALYVLTFGFDLQNTHPGLQSTIYNVANIVIRGWVGYRICVALVGRLEDYRTKFTGELACAIAYAANVLGRLLFVGLVILTSR